MTKTIRFLLAVLSVYALGMPLASAEKYNWIGGATGNWDNASSWSVTDPVGAAAPGGPTTTAAVTINGNVVVGFSATQTITIASLNLQNGAKIDFGTNGIVLNVNGGVTISTAGGGTITGNGSLNITSYAGGVQASFTNALLQIPLTINFTGSSSLAAFSAGAVCEKEVIITTQIVSIVNAKFTRSLQLTTSSMAALSGSVFGSLPADVINLTVTWDNTNSTGGNTFNGNTTWTNKGGALKTAGTLADTYNSDATFITQNTGSSAQIDRFGLSIYKGNVTLSNYSGYANLTFGELNTAGAVSIPGTITVNSTSAGHLQIWNVKDCSELKNGTFTNGNLALVNFTSAKQGLSTLKLSGGAAYISNTRFPGGISLTAPNISEITGSTFGKDSLSVDTIKATYQLATMSGGNVFYGNTVFQHVGQNSFKTAGTLGDTYHGNLTVSLLFSSSSAQIDRFGKSTFKRNVTLNNYSGFGSLTFGELNTNGAVSVPGTITVSSTSGGNIYLANVKDCQELKLGTYTNGNFSLANFTTSKPTLTKLTFPAGPVAFYSTKFPGGISLTAPNINEITGSTFGKDSLSVDTITVTYQQATMSGDNTFFGNTVFQQKGQNSFKTAGTLGDTYHGNLTVSLLFSSSSAQIDRFGLSTFKKNVTLSNYSGFGTLTFGELNTNEAVSIPGALVLNCTSAMNINVFKVKNCPELKIGTFSNGNLQLNNVACTRASQLLLDLNGGVSMVNCKIPGGLKLTASVIYNLADNVFGSGTSSLNEFTASGNVNTNWNGNNQFNGNTSFLIYSNQNVINTAFISGDTYNGNLTAIYPNSHGGALNLCYNGITKFNGNVSINGNVTFHKSSGIALFSSDSNQTISITPATITGWNPLSLGVFNNLTINKPSGNLILGVPLTINGTLNLTKGNIVSSAANPLILSASAVLNLSGSANFISGPVRKTGSQAFTFPVGKGTVNAPLTVTFPTAGATLTAEYINIGQALNTTLNAPIKELSKTEYWTLQDNVGNAGAVSISIPWKKGVNTTDVFDVTSLKLARSVASGAWNTVPATATGTTAAGMISTNSPLVLGAGISAFAFGFSGLSPNVLVTNNLDDLNPGSLRYAISKANESPDVSIITFAIQSPFTKNIKLSAPLPVISSLVHVDATTQPLYDPANAATHVEVSSDAGNTAGKGFQIGTGGKGSSIKGLQVTGFSSYGVLIQAEQVLVKETEIK